MHPSVEGPQLSGANARGGPKGLQGITRSYTAACLGRVSGCIQGREMQNMLRMSDKPSCHKTDTHVVAGSSITCMMLE